MAEHQALAVARRPERGVRKEHRYPAPPRAPDARPTPRTRRRVLLDYFEAVDARDLDRLLAAFDEDVVYERPGYTTLRGLARLRTFYEQERIIASGRHTVEGLVIEGDAAAAWGCFEGVSRSGERLQERWSDAYRFRGDRIVFRRSHFFRPAV